MSTVHRRYVGPVARIATRLDGREHVLERGDVVEVSEEQAEALDRTTVVDEDGEIVSTLWEEADAADFDAQHDQDDGHDQGQNEGPPEFETATVDEPDDGDADDEQEDDQ